MASGLEAEVELLGKGGRLDRRQALLQDLLSMHEQQLNDTSMQRARVNALFTMAHSIANGRQYVMRAEQLRPVAVASGAVHTVDKCSAALA